MNLYKELKKLEPFSISSHGDADGVYSTSILMKMFDIEEVEFPPFNEYTKQVAVDLGYPSIKGWKGIVIDHHVLDYPEEVFKNPDIKLFLGYEPTAKVMWNLMKDKIPKDQIWKLVGSCCGDGQCEKVPDEVWDAFPILLEERGFLKKGQYKVYTTSFPLFYYLSSGINAMCRQGFPHQALDVVNMAKGPLDIIDNLQVREAKEQMNSEEASVYKSLPVAETIKNRYIVVKVKPSTSGINMASLIASKISGNSPGKTIIVVDESTGKGSIRGVLAKYVSNKLVKAGFKSGGHYGFSAFTCDPSKIEDVLNIIRGL